jgi:hypothetical protein
MLVKDATNITGGLSAPGKMPCYSLSLDARICNVGSKLVKVPGSVCANCYALKGNYIKYQDNIQRAQARRLDALMNNPLWVMAMVVLVRRGKYFRWFDSGDIPDLKSLIKIVAVAKLTPGTIHWLPTKEYKLIFDYKKSGGIIPKNLIIRQSAPMLNGILPSSSGTSSMVITPGAKLPADTALCNASHQDNQCLDCRACWNPEILRVAYPNH